MQPADLLRARQVWLALLQTASVLESVRWQSWASRALTSATEPAPLWLIELSYAQSTEAAIDSLSNGIGLEISTHCEAAFDWQSLLIGLAFERYVCGEQSFEEAWAKLNQLTDVVEYIDAGKWRPFARPGTNSNIAPSGSRSMIEFCLAPVAAHATKAVNEIMSLEFGSSEA